MCATRKKIDMILCWRWAKILSLWNLNIKTRNWIWLTFSIVPWQLLSFQTWISVSKMGIGQGWPQPIYDPNFLENFYNPITEPYPLLHRLFGEKKYPAVTYFFPNIGMKKSSDLKRQETRRPLPFILVSNFSVHKYKSFFKLWCAHRQRKKINRKIHLSKVCDVFFVRFSNGKMSISRGYLSLGVSLRNISCWSIINKQAALLLRSTLKKHF